MSLSADEARRFREGDPELLAALFRRHRPEVELLLRRGFVFASAGGPRRFLGFANPADLEDRVHDVFVHAFAPQARAGFAEGGELSSWLRAIARNVAISWLRSRQARMERLCVAPEHPAAEAADGRRDALAAPPWEHAEIARVARHFLDALDADGRRLLELRFRREASQLEAATALGVSAPTLRKRERQLFEAFFAHMRRHGYFEHHAERRDLRTRRAGALVLLLAAWIAVLR